MDYCLRLRQFFDEVRQWVGYMVGVYENGFVSFTVESDELLDVWLGDCKIHQSF